MTSLPIDQLVYKAVFGTNEEKKLASFVIWQEAKNNNIFSASINDFYMAKGRGEVPSTLCTPAMNVRGMTYDVARAVFQTAIENNVGAFIFEIARSEMAYTEQTPQEYVTVILASALREGWNGPVFIQGDHFQAKAETPGVPKSGEIDAIKTLAIEAVKAGFYNIDIDMSTLVNLSQETVDAQQQPNIKYSLELANFIRTLQPEGITISLGGEIGHIGGKNSTVEDFTSFLDGFNAGLDPGMTGISKISVATGTHHGGVVLPDGTMADVPVDFSVLSSISKLGQEKYGIGGAVQHGASTLPDHLFNEFSKSGAVEIHLATGLQNLTMNHPAFPKDLMVEIYSWIDENKQDERGENTTNEQFHYELRKKAWGPFKQKTWDIEEEKKLQIRQAIKDRMKFFFESLGVIGSRDLVNNFIRPVFVEKKLEEFEVKSQKMADVRGLSD